MSKAAQWFDAVIEWLTPSSRLKIRFTGEMKRVQLEPGDVLVLSSDENISDDGCVWLRRSVEREFPGHKCLVLADGLKLGVMGVPTLTEEVYPSWFANESPRRPAEADSEGGEL